MYCLVLTTCPKDDEARIVETLLSSRLAACVNVLTVSSSYVWKEKIEHDNTQLSKSPSH